MGLAPRPARCHVLPGSGWWEPDATVASCPSPCSLLKPTGTRLGAARYPQPLMALPPCTELGTPIRIVRACGSSGGEPGAFPGHRRPGEGTAGSPRPAQLIAGAGLEEGSAQARKDLPLELAPRRPRACSPAAPGPTAPPAPPLRGCVAPRCLGCCWATFPSPQGPSGSEGWAAETGMCWLQQETSVHRAGPSWDRGWSQSQPTLLLAVWGGGDLPHGPSGQPCRCPLVGGALRPPPLMPSSCGNCSRVRWAELRVHSGHPWVPMPGSRVLVPWVGSAGAWKRGRHWSYSSPERCRASPPQLVGRAGCPVQGWGCPAQWGCQL